MKLMPCLPLLVLALSACGPDTDASGTAADEARQLNEAAAAMDINTTTPIDTPDDAPDQDNAQ